MKGIRYFVILVLFVLMASCGGAGSGGPGSRGTADVNVMVMVDMMPSQFGIAYEMDQDKCQLTRVSSIPDYNVSINTTNNHMATLFIKASLISPVMGASPLFVEKYTVTYRPTIDSIGAPPITTAEYRNASFVITPPLIANYSTLNCKMVFPAPDIIFFDMMRKAQYLTDVRSGKYSYMTSNYLNRYTATFTFTGKNADGKEFSFITQSDFQIGIF